jgi:hypothetical protein
MTLGQEAFDFILITCASLVTVGLVIYFMNSR